MTDLWSAWPFLSPFATPHQFTQVPPNHLPELNVICFKGLGLSLSLRLQGCPFPNFYINKHGSRGDTMVYGPHAQITMRKNQSVAFPSTGKSMGQIMEFTKEAHRVGKPNATQ